MKLRKTYVNTLAFRGSVRLLKWDGENNDWVQDTCAAAADNGQLRRAPSTCRRTGALGTGTRAVAPPRYKHWDCLQYAVDNKCPGWEDYAEEYAEHLR